MGANRAWQNPEVRLERRGSAERAAWSPDSAASPPAARRPQGGFEAGRGFDPGRPALRGAGQMRWGRGGGATRPRPCPPPAPRTAPWARRLFPAVAGGTRWPAPGPPPLQLFPSCPAPPQRQLGERLGGERGAAARLRAGTGEGSDLKELGPAGVAGSGNPRWSPPPHPRPRTSGPQELGPLPAPPAPRRWGGVDTLPTPSPSRKGSSLGEAGGHRRGVKVVSRVRHRVCL